MPYDLDEFISRIPKTFLGFISQGEDNLYKLIISDELADLNENFADPTGELSANPKEYGTYDDFQQLKQFLQGLVEVAEEKHLDMPKMIEEIDLD